MPELVSPAAEGASMVAGATANFFKTAGDAYFKFESKKNQIQAMNDVNENITSFERERDVMYDQWEKDNIENPRDASLALNDNLEGLKTKYSEGSFNPWAKTSFENKASGIINSTMRRAENWEDATLIDNTIRTTQDGLSQIQTNAYRNPNPDNLKLLKARSEDFLKAMDETADPRVAEKMRKDNDTALAAAMFQGLIDSNAPNAASALLKSGDFDEDLGASGVSGVRRSIETKRRFLEAKREEMLRLKASNPYKFLRKQGITLPALDPSRPENFEKKAQMIPPLEKQFDMPIPFMDTNEAFRYTKKIKQSPAAAQVLTLSNLSDLPDSVKSKFLESISQVDVPYAGVVSMIINGDNQDLETARKTIEGNQMIQTQGKDGAVPQIKLKDLVQPIDDYIGNSLRNGQGRESLLHAVRGHMMKDLSYQNKDVPDKEDILNGEEASWWETKEKSEFKKAVDALVGIPFKWNKDTVITPKDKFGMSYDQEEVSGSLDLIDAESLKRTFGDYPVNIDNNIVYIGKDLGGLRLVSHKKDQYKLEFNGYPLYKPFEKAKDRKPYILDLKKYYESQKSELDKRKKEGFFQKAFDSVIGPKY